MLYVLCAFKRKNIKYPTQLLRKIYHGEDWDFINTAEKRFISQEIDKTNMKEHAKKGRLIEVLKFAIKNNIAVNDYLIRYGKKGCKGNIRLSRKQLKIVLLGVCFSGNLIKLKRFLRVHRLRLEHNSVKYAALSGNYAMIKFVRSQTGSLVNEELITSIIKSGNLKCMMRHMQYKKFFPSIYYLFSCIAGTKCNKRLILVLCRLRMLDRENAFSHGCYKGSVAFIKSIKPNLQKLGIFTCFYSAIELNNKPVIVYLINFFQPVLAEMSKSHVIHFLEYVVRYALELGHAQTADYLKKSILIKN